MFAKDALFTVGAGIDEEFLFGAVAFFAEADGEGDVGELKSVNMGPEGKGKRGQEGIKGNLHI